MPVLLRACASYSSRHAAATRPGLTPTMCPEGRPGKEKRACLAENWLTMDVNTDRPGARHQDIWFLTPSLSFYRGLLVVSCNSHRLVTGMTNASQACSANNLHGAAMSPCYQKGRHAVMLARDEG